MLRRLPRNLDETYGRILSDIDDVLRSDAMKLLRWLAYAQSPPTLAELTEIPIIDPSGPGSVRVDDRGGLEDALDILSGLVIVEASDGRRNRYHPGSRTQKCQTDLRKSHDTKVRLAHFSVKEFLESERIATSSLKDFHLRGVREHDSLAQTCLTYLLHYSSDGSRTMSEKDLAIYPLLEYAAQSWPFHSSFQDGRSIEREVSLLTLESTRRDWLRIYQPDLPQRASFGHIHDVGSGLYYASVLGLEPVVYKILRMAETSIDEQGGEYGSAVGAASAKDHCKIVKLLFAHTADLDIRGYRGKTALHHAVLNGCADCVSLLLGRQA